jgi:L-rhamnose mutarotase
MDRFAFTMKLTMGFEKEYKRRHDDIWPELSQLLVEDGVLEYYIYLDEQTGTLFAFMKRGESNLTSPLRQHPVMRRWWDYMKDIMETNEDGSPVTRPLIEVFDLHT